MTNEKLILAIVGMPGAGKSEAAYFLKNHKIPFIRFGDYTEEELEKRGLSMTAENEREVRESIREKKGMGAYAVWAKPKIEDALQTHTVVVLDGLYSWEEYKYLKNIFPELVLIHVYAEPKIRYDRLQKRAKRPFTQKESYERDVAELENLNKGGPIAMADFLVENNSDDLKDLHRKLDALLSRLGIGAQ